MGGAGILNINRWYEALIRRQAVHVMSELDNALRAQNSCFARGSTLRERVRLRPFGMEDA